MSGPSSSYDPKQVAMLAPEALDDAVTTAVKAFAEAPDLDALGEQRRSHLGDRSPVALARRELGALPPQARADAGRRVNEARAAIQAAYDDRFAQLTAERDDRVLREEAVDVTLPWDRSPVGARHPLTTIMERVADVFAAMGYEVAEGPEAEAEWYNFDALNMGPDHPARSMHDTLWLDPPERGVLLRTHTSPVQIRALLTRELPVYVVCPGRTFRADALDATQDAFVAAFRRARSFRGDAAFGTWIYRIAINAAQDLLRRRGRDSLVDDEQPDVRASGPADRVEETAVARLDVARALVALAPEYREAVVMHDLGGVPYDEIAQLTGAPMGTVKSRISRGRRQLAELLEQRAAREPSNQTTQPNPPGGALS